MPDSASTNTITTMLSAKKQAAIDITSGLISGASCAVFLNPYDQALYLATIHNRNFLSKENFTKPFHGASQAFAQRAILGSIYFVMQGEMKSHLYPYLKNTLQLNETISQMAVGLTSGAIYGAVINPMSAVKYHTWGQKDRTFLSSLRNMYSDGGLKPLMNGMWATVGRDMVFGSSYEILRTMMYDKLASHTEENPNLKFACNMLAGGTSAIFAGPLNYVRNIQYATPPEAKSISTIQALKDVWQESKQQPTILSKAGFFQQRFRIGWGTARVAISMGAGQWLFDKSRDVLEEIYRDNSDITTTSSKKIK